MAGANYVKFNKRVNLIERRHRKMSNGYVQMVERDGLLVPRVRRVKQRGFPFKGVFLSIALFFVFKAILLVQLGTATYEQRLSLLEGGNGIERAGATVLANDPLTVWIGAQLTSLF